MEETMLGFVLSLLIAFQGTGTPAADTDFSDQLAAAAVYAGQEALAAREFRAGDEAESASGIVLIRGSVRVFGTSDEAVDALAESIAANLETESFAAAEEQDAPGYGDESQAFAGELPNGGFFGIVFVVQDNALYRYIAASVEDDPLPELVGLVEGWLEGVEATDDALGLLPDEDDVPAGFTLHEEGSVTNDGEPRPATPVA